MCLRSGTARASDIVVKLAFTAVYICCLGERSEPIRANPFSTYGIGVIRVLFYFFSLLHNHPVFREIGVSVEAFAEREFKFFVNRRQMNEP